MKEIHYTSHLKYRMKVRNVPENFPKEVYNGAKEKYYDRETLHYIAVKEAFYRGKTREVIVVYDERPKRIEIITIHPLVSTQ